VIRVICSRFYRGARTELLQATLVRFKGEFCRRINRPCNSANRDRLWSW